MDPKDIVNNSKTIRIANLMRDERLTYLEKYMILIQLLMQLELLLDNNTKKVIFEQFDMIINEEILKFKLMEEK